MHRSYIAVVVASPGNLLVGGVKEHRSSRFETREQAEAFLKVILEGNAKAMRNVDHAAIIPSKRAPEITA